MQKFKKGQGASEYLILLAVVLIIGIIAVALLGGFSDIGSGAMQTEALQYWSSSRPFSITEWSQTGNTISLTIKNNEPNVLKITNITIGNVSYAPTGGLSFGGGSKKTISISGLPQCNATTYDYYEYNVQIVYSSNQIQGMMQKGQRPLVGKCHES